MKGWILQHDARIAITWLSLVVMRWSYQAWYYAKLPLRVYFIIFQEESLKRDSHELNTCRIISYNNIYVYTFEKPWQPVWERCNLRKGSWPGKMLGEHRFHGNDDCKYGVWENAIREANGTTSHAWFTQWPSPPRRRPSLEAAAERRPPSVTRATPGTHRRWEHSPPPPLPPVPIRPAPSNVTSESGQFVIHNSCQLPHQSPTRAFYQSSGFAFTRLSFFAATAPAAHLKGRRPITTKH